MVLTIQILTIIIDVLLILFVLLLVLMAWKAFSVVRHVSKFTKNMSDLHFWFNLFRSIPGCCKPRGKG